MVEVKYIQIDNTPTTWLPNAIYFVRNTGQIWQTDGSAVPVLYASQQQQIIQFGGFWKLYDNDGADRWHFLNSSYGSFYTLLKSFDVSGRDNQTLMRHHYLRGKIVRENQVLKKVILASRYCGDELNHFQLVIGRRELLNGINGGVYIDNAEVIAELDVNYQSATQMFLVYNISSDIITQENDEIAFFLRTNEMANDTYFYTAHLSLFFEEKI